MTDLIPHSPMPSNRPADVVKLDAEHDRPLISAIVATSVDGRIADAGHTAARFGSAQDQQHLRSQVAKADGFLLGANTLRSYGTSVELRDPEQIQQRQQRGQPPQPWHFVGSRSGEIDPTLPFFQQPIRRGLLTTVQGGQRWQGRSEFDCVISGAIDTGGELNWKSLLQSLKQMGIDSLLVGGGGQVIGSLMAAGLLDELWVTLCPLVLGSQAVPVLTTAQRWTETTAPRLQLQSMQAIGSEVFLHYLVLQDSQD